MFRKVLLAVVGLYVAGAVVWVVSAGVVRDTGEVELLNVACDPTRELWQDLNAKFVARYQVETGKPITILQAHGGSGSQARAVSEGLRADVVTLALWTDTDAVRKAGLIEPGWEDKLPNRSLPYTSTIVFVVRKGNPKGIRDWPDLLSLKTKDVKDDSAGVVTPNPKTSGNGKWSFLAAWGSVLRRGGSEAEAREFVTAVYDRVRVLDTAARGATTTFQEKKIGDVHLTWENEAYLEVEESRKRGASYELEIVYPKASVLAEPHVAVVDAVVDAKGTRAAAEAYMKYLYTEEAQEVIAHHHYRPTNESVRVRTADRFRKIDLFPATITAPDWAAIQKKFFAEGGEFDRMYAVGGGK